jgi:hypothetical protein
MTEKMLLPLFGPHITNLISDCLGLRCHICDDEKGVMLKDAFREWQFWCITCFSRCCEDELLQYSVDAMMLWYYKSFAEVWTDTVMEVREGMTLCEDFDSVC